MIQLHVVYGNWLYMVSRSEYNIAKIWWNFVESERENLKRDLYGDVLLEQYQ